MLEIREDNQLDSYLSPGAKKIITVSIVSVHVAFLVLPLLFFAVRDWVNPPVIVLKVCPVPSPITNSPKPGPSPTDPDSTATDIPDPKPLDSDPLPDIKPIPDDPPDSPEPPQPPKEKAKPEQHAKPEKPTETVKIPKDEAKKPEKPKYLSASDIRKTGNRVKSNSRDKQKAAAQRAAAAAEAKRRAALAGAIRNLKADGGGGSPGQLADKDFLNYYAKAKEFIEPRWIQPNRDSLQGKAPSVDLEITIDRNGRVTASRITRKSGIAAMDASVESLLAKLTVLPAPPKAMTLPITLRITSY